MSLTPLPDADRGIIQAKRERRQEKEMIPTVAVEKVNYAPWALYTLRSCDKHTHTHTHTHKRTHTRTHTYKRTNAHTHTRTHTYTHAQTQTHTHTHTHIHTHAQTHTHAHTHTRTHTYTHTKHRKFKPHSPCQTFLVRSWLQIASARCRAS